MAGPSVRPFERPSFGDSVRSSVPSVRPFSRPSVRHVDRVLVRPSDTADDPNRPPSLVILSNSSNGSGRNLTYVANLMIL